ncbi:MAG: T9SS type A sorting domain-containing protein [Candidatus Poribacteria bacterium]|nr:T9SS type A sorting domain-containing protein [Candidatus Poribacteria bacterium]
MKTQFFRQKGFVFIFGTILMVTFGTLNISYAQEGNPTITASVEEPLTEANLHGNVVTLTLSGSVYTRSEFTISRALTVSGIGGVTFDSWDVDRVSDSKVTVELTFSGNIDTDTNLVFTVGAGGIADYDGAALTAQVPVTALAETLVATTESPLTEATLSGSIVTLTLSGRNFNDEWNVYNALTVSGIEGASFDKFDVERISGTKVTVPLTFSGNIDADATLTLTVGADAIVGYNQGFTVQLSVTAVEESLVATTESPLTEATLSGSVVTLTLSGRSFVEYSRDPIIAISGIEGANIARFGIKRVSATKLAVTLTFSGDIDADATLTITVNANAIAGYNKGFTLQLPVTTVEESLVATTESPLTEATLSGSVVTLTLSGRSFVGSEYDIERALTISGIEGVAVDQYDVDRVNNTKVTVPLIFSGNIDTDATLTITVDADVIIGYNQGFTVQLPVTAVEESLVASTVAPLTEATLSGSVVTLTLSGRSFVEYSRDPIIAISGIEGVNIARYGIKRVSTTKMTVELTFSGNIDTDATLTITVNANAIVGYNQGFTLQLPVTAVEESLVATTETPLTEVTLSGSVVALKLSGRNFARESDITDALTVTGIEGVFVSRWGVDRVSNTEVKVTLISSVDFDTDGVLTITVGADAILGYNQGFSFEFPVTAVEESLIATTETPLTEASLTGSVVTLTLSGRHFTDEWDIRDALSFTGIEGVFVSRDSVERVSNTEVKVTLLFAGNIDTNGILNLEVGADAISSYNEVFTFEFPVTAVEERLEISTESPLTEAMLNGGVITLKLIGRQFTWWRWEIEDAVTLTGVEGLTIGEYYVEDEELDEVIIPLAFDGNIDTNATLTIEVGAGAIAGYNEAFTAQIPVTAVEESLDISSKFDLTEATLNGTEVILKLNGRSYASSFFDINDEVSITGIEGVSFDDFFDVDRVSHNEVAVELSYDGTDFDTDSTLTFTVGAGAISGYGKALTAQIPVTAIKQSGATISISPNPIVSPPLFELLTVSLKIAGGENVAGFQAIVTFDDNSLDYRESAKGNYLPADAFFVAPTVPDDEFYPYHRVPIAATALDDVSNGNGTLATLTFEVYDVVDSKMTLSDVYIVDREGVRWEVEIEGAEVTEPAHDIVGDINRDGVVNIRDLVLVSWRFGLRGENRADINSDGIVDIADLVLVANELGADAAAPPLNSQILELLTATDVKDWLTQARQLSLTDPAYLRGITVLEQLHKALTPKKTALLPNFPNPFNPETWIPYHLSKDADVTLHIYAVNGTLVRSLMLGHQAAGRYQSRSRAAHWDGKNEFGEPVASGVYFYTLTSGDFSATRKMLIRK